jgi:hypothetical protein
MLGRASPEKRRAPTLSMTAQGGGVMIPSIRSKELPEYACRAHRQLLLSLLSRILFQ